MRRLLPPLRLLLLLQNLWQPPLPQLRQSNPLPLSQNRLPPQPLLRNLPQLPKPHLQPSLPNPLPPQKMHLSPSVVPMPRPLLPQNLSLLKNLP